MTRTKADIIDDIYEKVGFTRAEIAKIVESVFDIMKETVQREDRIMISGFGVFATKNKRPEEEETHRRGVTYRSAQEEL